MTERDEARRQYWIDWTEAILEDIYRELWARSSGRWKRRRGG